jgi:LPS-assembly protein
MRRTGGLLNELSRVVYSSCDLCKSDPTHPPLWQIKAASAVQDTEHKTIEYRDATLQMDGIPVAYTPWLMHPDPSVPRQSGILPPVMGNSSGLGAFFGVPYYLVIDGQSDATFIPLIATRAGAVIDTQYRRRFNDGTLFVSLSGGYEKDSFQGSLAMPGVGVSTSIAPRPASSCSISTLFSGWPATPTCCLVLFIWKDLARDRIRGSMSKRIRV